MIIRHEKGCAILFHQRDLKGLRVDLVGRHWLRIVDEATLQNQHYHLLGLGEVYVVLGFGYNAHQDYRPILDAIITKLQPRVAKMATSPASITQKMRFATETITGSLNYTCGEVPVFSSSALRAIDLIFFRWVKRLLGLG